MYNIYIFFSLSRSFTGTLNASYIILGRVDLSICTHNHKATSQTWYSDIEWCGEVEGIRYRDERSHTGNLIRLRLVHFNKLCGCFSSLCPGWNKFVTDKTWKSSLFYDFQTNRNTFVRLWENELYRCLHRSVTVVELSIHISSSLTNSVIYYWYCTLALFEQFDICEQFWKKILLFYIFLHRATNRVTLRTIYWFIRCERMSKQEWFEKWQTVGEGEGEKVGSKISPWLWKRKPP